MHQLLATLPSAGAGSGSAHPASRPPQAHHARATTPKHGHRACPSSRARCDPSVIRTDDNHPVHVRLEDPGDLPAAAGHLQRDPVRWQQAFGQHRDPLRCCSAPARRTEPSRPHRSRPHRNRGEHPDRSHDLSISPKASSPPSTRLTVTAGEPAGQRHRPIRARSSIQANRRGGRTKMHGLEAHRSLRPTRLRSPKQEPLSWMRRNLGPAPDRASERQFHASRRGTGVTRSRISRSTVTRPSTRARPGHAGIRQPSLLASAGRAAAWIRRLCPALRCQRGARRRTIDIQPRRWPSRASSVAMVGEDAGRRKFEGDAPGRMRPQ